jgi:hypothetical protein
MGLITDVNKNETGKALKAYYENSLPLVVQVKENLTKLTDQYEAMLLNTADYSKVDCEEVKALIDDLTSKIENI